MPTTVLTDQQEALIPLRDGPVVRTSVVMWLLDASERLKFRIRTDGRLGVSPESGITADDDRFISEHREELLAAVRYVEHISERPI